MRKQNYPIPERRCLVFLDGVVERWLFRIEDASPQRVRRKQSVPTRMPVGWIPRILRVVDHADGDNMLAGVIASQDAPAPASRPDCSALDSLAGQINSGRACGIGAIYLSRPSVCIHEDAALFVCPFKPVCDSHTKQPFLIVVEDSLVESLESDDLIDDAGVLTPHKDVARSVLQKVLALACHPERLDDKLSSVRPALGRDNL